MTKITSPLQLARDAEAEASTYSRRISEIEHEKASLEIDNSKPALEAATKVVEMEKRYADELAVLRQAHRIAAEKVEPAWELAKLNLLPTSQEIEEKALDVQSRVVAALEKTLFPLVGDFAFRGSNSTLTAANELVATARLAVGNSVNGPYIPLSTKAEDLNSLIELAPAAFANIEAGIAKLQEAEKLLKRIFPTPAALPA